MHRLDAKMSKANPITQSVARAPTQSQESQTRTTKEQSDLATAAGHGWAERKAATLEGAIPAVDWPDTWSPAWGESLPFRSGEVDPQSVPVLLAIASHAAAERWAELVSEHRAEESADEEEVDLEIEAVRLFEAVRDALPEGLTVVRNGERVCLVDEAGKERTITSLEQASRVLGEWKEDRSL